MRTRRLALLALALPMLAGCSLLPYVPGFPHPAPTALDVGTCLDGMNGSDSDRTAVIDCDQPHLFEVTGVSEWPGMADALKGSDPGGLWDEIQGVHGADDAFTDYWLWASTTCEKAAQHVLRIDDVEVDGKTAADIYLRIGAGYGVDRSLDSRAGFVAGDHSTVCSVAWYDARDQPLKVTFDDDLSFADAIGPKFPLEHRECWDTDFYPAPCQLPHGAQVLVSFDGVEALGTELVEALGSGDGTEDEWKVADDLCDDLIAQTLPGSADFGDDLGYLSEIGNGAGWDDWDGTVDPDMPYPFACVALGPEGSEFEGDVFNGTAELVSVPDQDHSEGA